MTDLTYHTSLATSEKEMRITLWLHSECIGQGNSAPVLLHRSLAHFIDPFLKVSSIEIAGGETNRLQAYTFYQLPGCEIQISHIELQTNLKFHSLKVHHFTDASDSSHSLVELALDLHSDPGCSWANAANNRRANWNPSLAQHRARELTLSTKKLRSFADPTDVLIFRQCRPRGKTSCQMFCSVD